MKVASIVERVPAGREGLWWEFNRALAGRNFVRAVEVARELSLDEQRIRPIQLDALRQFLVEYQNFDGATRLCAEYCITSDELAALSAHLPGREKLESQTTFSLRDGRPTYQSIAAQIRTFIEHQRAFLSAPRVRRSAAWVKRVASKVRSWLDSLSDRRRGGVPRGGLAWQ